MNSLIKYTIFLLLYFSFTIVNAQVSFTNSGQSLGDFTNIAIGDIDGDSDMDIVALYFNESNKIWVNDGNGNYSPADTMGTRGNAVALADLDNDGDLDAFIVDGGYYSIDKPATVWMNDGTGNFTNSGQELGGRYSTDVALADLDGDNDIDAFVCNHAFEGSLTKGGHEVWLNDGTGQFTNSGQDLGNAYHTSVHLDDIDNDGDMDALVTNNYNELNVTNENEIWINDGGGTFSKKVLSSPYSLDLSLADVDGDDDNDVVIGYVNFLGSSNIGAKLFLNDGNGNYSASTLSFDKTQYSGAETGDLNNDGNIDILFANGHQFADSPNKIWIGDGTGIFITSDFSFGSDDGTFVKLAYLNNDDRLDAIVGDKIWLNTTVVIDYPGEVLPDTTPIRFAADLLGKAWTVNFRPDGKEIYFPDENNPRYILKKSSYVEGQWTTPEVTNLKPWALLPDGRGFYGTANRNGSPDTIYKFTWTPYGQSSPVPVLTANDDLLIVRASDNGNLYFSQRINNGNWDIYISKLVNGVYQEPEKLPASINSAMNEQHFFIAPDESYILFDVENPNPWEIFGIYVSFHIEDGSWTNRVNIGIPSYMGCVSPDGKYIFYNGEVGVNWVDIKILDKFKPISNAMENPTTKPMNECLIYPNPAKNTLQIKYPYFLNKNMYYRILDLTGKLQQQGKLSKNIIDVSQIGEGIFLLSIDVDGKETINQNIIIQY